MLCHHSLLKSAYLHPPAQALDMHPDVAGTTWSDKPVPGRESYCKQYTLKERRMGLLVAHSVHARSRIVSNHSARQPAAVSGNAAGNQEMSQGTKGSLKSK